MEIILPADILKVELIKYLTVPTFLKYCQISRQFKTLNDDPKIWRYFVQRDFPSSEYRGNYPQMVYPLANVYRRDNPLDLPSDIIQMMSEVPPMVFNLISVLPKTKLINVCQNYCGPMIKYELNPNLKLSLRASEAVRYLSFEILDLQRSLDLSLDINEFTCDTINTLQPYLRDVTDLDPLSISEITFNLGLDKSNCNNYVWRGPLGCAMYSLLY